MKIILIDDEPIALDVLERMLLSYKSIEVIGRYTDPRKALEEIEKHTIDAIFLDIEMGDMNGLEIGNLISARYSDLEIVFVTAYSQYAVDAFEIQAMDYLLKPIHSKRLDKTVRRLLERHNERQDAVPGDFEDKIRISSFGNFNVYDSDGKAFIWRTRKTKELFAYLWANKDKVIDKMSIIEDIFADKNFEQATTLLHTTVYQLRNSLKKAGYPKAIRYVNEGYNLAITCESDRDELNHVLVQGRMDDDNIKKIMSLYTGDFMQEGYFWAMEEQHKYKQKIYEIVCDFAESRLAEGLYTRLLGDYLMFIYRMEPTDDRIANLIITYYGEQKQKHNLEEFYKNHVSILVNEMGIDPAQSTKEMYLNYAGNKSR